MVIHHNQIYPPLEEVLVKWATKNRYILRDRMWKSECILGKQIDYAVNGPDKFSRVLSGGNEQLANSIAQHLDIVDSDLMRDIWTPTGVVEYKCFFADGGGNERILNACEDYLKLCIEHVEGRGMCESVYLHHGPRIDDWQNEKISRKERMDNAICEIHFNTSEEEISVRNETLEINFRYQKLRKRKDPTSQILCQMLFLNAECNFNTNPPPESFRKLNIFTINREPIDIEDIILPDNKESYKKILSHWSEAINNTE